MRRRFVYGVYRNIAEAEQQADQITEAGVAAQSISLVADQSMGNDHSGQYDFIPAEETIDDRSWIQKLFGMDSEDQPAEGLNFSDYSDALENKQVLLVVDSEFEGILNQENITEKIEADFPEHTQVQSPLTKDRSALVEDPLGTESETDVGLDGRIDPPEQPRK